MNAFARRRLRWLALPVLAALLSGVGAPGDASAPPAPASKQVRGVALGLFATDPEWDYGPMVDEIRDRGATDVLVVVNAHQRTRMGADVAMRPGLAPSLANVERTLRAVRAAGMRAALMPVVRLLQRSKGEWRGRITPADGLDAWFDAYRRFVLPLASMAQHAGAARFVVGSELGSLERYEDHWRGLIGEVRARFDGTLTYSANWDRAAEVPFWDAVDEVGLTAYFPLDVAGALPSQQALRRAWRQGPARELSRLSAQLGRPLLVTEVGYASQRGAARHPWDETRQDPIDLELQRRLYTAFCGALSELDAVDGFYVWNWFGFGGPRDSGFTPRGKPAARALQSCLQRAPGQET